MLAEGACLLVVENAIPGILGIGHVLAPPNVLHCPNFPPASPRCCCSCTPHCTIVLQNCTPLVQSAASQSEYSTVLNCLPLLPSPAPNFCQLCPSLLHCRAQGGHPNQGLYPLLFSRASPLYPFTQPKNLTAPPCQADKKPTPHKNGLKTAKVLFCPQMSNLYLAIFTPTFMSLQVSSC